MKGRHTFTSDEIAKIKSLIEAKVVASLSEQKRIRDQIRQLGFYFSDFSGKKGYIVADLNELIKTGKVQVVDISKKNSYEHKETEFYAHYGRFIVNFENTLESIRAYIGFLMQYPDDNKKINPYVDGVKNIMLQGLTAQPLIDKFFALLAFRVQDNKVLLKRAKRVRDKITNELIPSRNKLSHGTTTFGVIAGTEDQAYLDVSKFSLAHANLKAKRYHAGYMEVDVSGLKKLNESFENLERCLQLIIRANVSVNIPTSDNFEEAFGTIDFKLKMVENTVE